MVLRARGDARVVVKGPEAPSCSTATSRPATATGAQYAWRHLGDRQCRGRGSESGRDRDGPGRGTQQVLGRAPLIPSRWLTGSDVKDEGTMSIRPYRDIHRRKSRQIMVGKVPVGGDAPITVQTMTNTITGDARATIEQIRGIEEAGADIVRVSCPDEDATAALKEIAKASAIPIVADIHFHYKRAIEAAKDGAACLRINPGNIGSRRSACAKW